MPQLRVAVDIGGTFTDICILDQAKDPEEAARRAVRVAREGMATSISGKPFPIRAESYCIHSDTPNAIALAETVTQALQPWLAA